MISSSIELLDSIFCFIYNIYDRFPLLQEQPEDFVIATGVQYSVRQFVEMAAAQLGIKPVVAAAPARCGEDKPARPDCSTAAPCPQL